MRSASSALSSLARSSGWSGAPRAASRSSISGQRGQRAGDELGQVAVVTERAAGEPGEGVVVDAVERVGRPQRQRRLGATQRGAVGPQVRRAGERQPVEQPGQRVGQHVDRDRDGQAGEQQHRQRGLAGPTRPGRSTAGRRTAAPPRPSPRRTAACRPAAPGPRRTHPRSRPRRRAVRRRIRWTPTPASSAPDPSGMTRIALPSAKNSVATTTNVTTGRGGFTSDGLHHRAQRRQRDHREHHPVAQPQRTVDVARHRRAEESDRRDDSHERDLAGPAAPGVARPRHLEQHREPRDAGHGDEVDLDAAEHVGEAADHPHRVERDHRRRNWSGRSRPAPARVCVGHGPAGRARTTSSARTPPLTAQPWLKCGMRRADYCRSGGAARCNRAARAGSRPAGTPASAPR